MIAKPGVVYPYEHITGSLNAIVADTRTAFPRLQTVGGYLDASGDYSHVKQNEPSVQNVGEDIRKKCRSFVLPAFADLGFSFADGVLSRIVSRRGPVTRVVICGKTDVSYIVTDGENFSHGKTLKEARDGLLYKIGDRDTSEFKAWTMDKVVSKRDAIRAYRVITGACEAGVRQWMSQRETPEKITVQGIIDITAGAYGSDAFKKFFQDGGK